MYSEINMTYHQEGKSVLEAHLVNEPLDLVHCPLLLRVKRILSDILVQMNERVVWLLYHDAVAHPCDSRLQHLPVPRLHLLLSIQKKTSNDDELGLLTRDDGHSARIGLMEVQETLLDGLPHID